MNEALIFFRVSPRRQEAWNKLSLNPRETKVKKKEKEKIFCYKTPKKWHFFSIGEIVTPVKIIEHLLSYGRYALHKQANKLCLLTNINHPFMFGNPLLLSYLAQPMEPSHNQKNHAL